MDYQEYWRKNWRHFPEFDNCLQFNSFFWLCHFPYLCNLLWQPGTDISRFLL